MDEHLFVNSKNAMSAVVLLDGSKSMADPITMQDGTRISKAEAAATALNDLIYAWVKGSQNSDDGTLKDYYYSLVLRFNDEHVVPAFPPPLDTNQFHAISQVAAHPLRVEGTSAIWVEPLAQGGTPMRQALDDAYLAMSQQIQNCLNTSFGTCLIVGDGEGTDGEPFDAAERIRNLQTKRGPVTLFSIALGTGGSEPVMFPSSKDLLPGDDYSQLLFEISSPLPTHMLEAARREGFEVNSNSRALVYNADASVLFRAMRAGTIVER